MLCSFESNVHLFQSVFSLKIRVCIQFKGSLQSMEYSNLFRITIFYQFSSFQGQLIPPTPIWGVKGHFPTGHWDSAPSTFSGVTQLPQRRGRGREPLCPIDMQRSITPLPCWGGGEGADWSSPALIGSPQRRGGGWQSLCLTDRWCSSACLGGKWAD